MEAVAIVAMVVAGLAGTGALVATLRAFRVADQIQTGTDRLIDAGYERAGLLVKITELKSANHHLFEYHVKDSKEIDDLRRQVSDWQVAYESLVEEIEGGDDDDGEWPDDEDGDDGPDDDDKVVTESDDDKVVTDEMLRPSRASREWLKSNDIEWGEDDPR